MQYSFFNFLLFLGSLGLFLYGMKTMSEGLQKMAGDKLRHFLTVMTKNRFAGLLTGLLITGLIQSSSATTVMVVSFVNAGLLSLSQSISVILGANIGTTVTAWIISVFGYKMDMSAFTLPILAIGIPFIFSKNSFRKSLGEFIYGFAFLFMGIAAMRANVPDIASNPEIMEFVTKYTDMQFMSVVLFFFIGAILTVIIQSSSATMAIILVMSAQGWISFEMGCAMVLGENLGTTVTANIAALAANVSAKRAALSHFMFNLFGVMWVLVFFYPLTSLVSQIVNYLASGDEMQTIMSFKLSMFHTCFNVLNTCIFIGLIGFLEKLVVQLIPKNEEEEEEFRLKYIQSNVVSTAELSVIEAQQEINLYSFRINNMFGLVRGLLYMTNEKEFNKLFERIEKYEDLSDNMELEIGNYLNKISEGRLSANSKREVQVMLRDIADIECIGDRCYNIARTITKKKNRDDDFTDSQYLNLEEMFNLITSSLVDLQKILEKDKKRNKYINEIYQKKSDINDLYQQLKISNLTDIDNKEYSYEIGIIYMDIVDDCEKLANYIISIAEIHSDQPVNENK